MSTECKPTCADGAPERSVLEQAEASLPGPKMHRRMGAFGVEVVPIEADDSPQSVTLHRADNGYWHRLGDLDGQFTEARLRVDYVRADVLDAALVKNARLDAAFRRQLAGASVEIDAARAENATLSEEWRKSRDDLGKTAAMVGRVRDILRASWPDEGVEDAARRVRAENARLERGLAELQEADTCPACEGHGFHMVNAHGPQEVKCDDCEGTGLATRAVHVYRKQRDTARRELTEANERYEAERETRAEADRAYEERTDELAEAKRVAAVEIEARAEVETTKLQAGEMVRQADITVNGYRDALRASEERLSTTQAEVERLKGRESLTLRALLLGLGKLAERVGPLTMSELDELADGVTEGVMAPAIRKLLDEGGK